MTDMFQRVTFCVLVLIAAGALAGDVSVDWYDGDDHLYDSSGSDMRVGQSRFQLVLDMSGNTDVAGMISDNYWSIGTEDPDASLYDADDDVTITAQNTNWTSVDDFAFVFNDSLYDETSYASKRFYFRFFNATLVGDATEAGLVYSTANQWVTAASSLVFEQAIPDLGKVGTESTQIAGSTDGSNADGWATMADPSGPASSMTMIE
jgi:hypothetical protein